MDVGCLGNRVSLQVRATTVAGQAVTRGKFVSLSRALNESVLFLKCVIGNYRNYELFLVCATYMYDIYTMMYLISRWIN